MEKLRAVVAHETASVTPQSSDAPIVLFYLFFLCRRRVAAPTTCAEVRYIGETAESRRKAAGAEATRDAAPACVVAENVVLLGRWDACIQYTTLRFVKIHFNLNENNQRIRTSYTICRNDREEGGTDEQSSTAPSERASRASID